MDTLDLLADIEPILPQLLEHPNALPFLLSLPSYPAQPLLHRLYANPSYALHPNLRHYLPHSHPLKKLVQGGREAAWTHLELGRGALTILAEGTGDDLLEIGKGRERTNLAILLEYADKWAKGVDEESKKCLELVLDILEASTMYSDPIACDHVARIMPRLAIISKVKGSDRTLKFPESHARTVVQKLLEATTSIVDGQSCWPAAVKLAQPFVSHLDSNDPLRLAFTPSQRSEQESLSFPDTLDGRRLSRLQQALFLSLPVTPADPGNQYTSGIHHQATPFDLLTLLAPRLLTSLQTAPVPPLGIPTLLNPTPDSHASAWAGKVYSSHEFRDRDRDRDRDRAGEGEGLRIAAGIGRGIGIGIGVGGGGGGGGEGEGGVGVGGSIGVGGMTRPASRHVDDYA